MEETERTYTQAEAEALVSERLAAQKNGYEQSLRAQEQTLNEYRKQLHAHELRERAQALLQEKGLPQSLLGALRLEDEHTLSQSLSCAEGAFRAALEEGVRARLRADAGEPVAPESPRSAARMSYRQAAEMYSHDPINYHKNFGGK